MWHDVLPEVRLPLSADDADVLLEGEIVLAGLAFGATGGLKVQANNEGVVTDLKGGLSYYQLNLKAFMLSLRLKGNYEDRTRQLLELLIQTLTPCLTLAPNPLSRYHCAFLTSHTQSGWPSGASSLALWYRGDFLNGRGFTLSGRCLQDCCCCEFELMGGGGFIPLVLMGMSTKGEEKANSSLVDRAAGQLQLQN